MPFALFFPGQKAPRTSPGRAQVKGNIISCHLSGYIFIFPFPDLFIKYQIEPEPEKILT
jgi:hypothetical protein